MRLLFLTLRCRINCGALSSGNAGAVSGFFDFAGDGFGDAFVEDGGDDVFGMKFLIGDEVGVGGGEFHVFHRRGGQFRQVDARGMALQRAFEENQSRSSQSARAIAFSFVASTPLSFARASERKPSRT